MPDLVVGDGDSLRADVASFYEAAGCVVLPPSADQDTTDLHKAVAAALRRPSCGWLVAVGCLGGRLDHTLAALSLLHDASLPTTDAPFTLVGESSSATLLRPGAHELAPWREVEGPKCGLVPLGAPRTLHFFHTSHSCKHSPLHSFVTMNVQPSISWPRGGHRVRLAVADGRPPPGNGRPGVHQQRAGRRWRGGAAAAGEGHDGRARRLDHAAAAAPPALGSRRDASPMKR